MKHIQFEAKKHALRQTQDGSVTISLNIHPDDVDPRLLMAPMGKVFQVVMVDPDDLAAEPPADEQPAPETKDTLTQQAAIMCQGVRWMEFVSRKYPQMNYPDGATAMRDLCRVKSRKEIKQGSAAGELFMRVRSDFDAYLQHDVI